MTWIERFREMLRQLYLEWDGNLSELAALTTDQIAQLLALYNGPPVLTYSNGAVLDEWQEVLYDEEAEQELSAPDLAALKAMLTDLQGGL